MSRLKKPKNYRTIRPLRNCGNCAHREPVVPWQGKMSDWKCARGNPEMWVARNPYMYVCDGHKREEE